MSTVHIVDGSGYIFRAFYAVQSLSNAQGMPTNALYGFTRMMLKLLRDRMPEFLAVTFDCREPTFRHELYTGYKANRAECPQDLQQQMPYFRKIVDALGLAYFEKPGFEADDIIASIVKRCAMLGCQVNVISGDKDLTQLVDSNCVVFDAMRELTYDTAGVTAKFGVRPDQMLDYLSLLGDSSDNVPGVKGVGEKTAQRLIQEFGSIEALLANLGKVKDIAGLRGAAGVAAKIESAREQLRLSRSLIQLDSDVKPFCDMESLELLRVNEPCADKFVPLFQELGFHKLLEEFSGAIAATPQAPATAKNYEVVTAQTLPSLAKKLSQAAAFAFDTETTGFDPLSVKLVGISVSWETNTGFYIPIGHSDSSRNVDLAAVRDELGPIFANSRIGKVGLNLKYDVRVLQAQGIPVEGLLFDSMIAAYVLRPDQRQYGLKALAQSRLHETMRTYEEVLGTCDTLADAPLESVANYAAHDADASWSLYRVLESELPGRSPPSLRYAFEAVEMPLVPVLAAMEQTGIALDVGLLQNLEREFNSELEVLERDIHELAGTTFNINSPKQLSDILFEQLGLPTQGLKRTNTGFSTNAAVLQRFAGRYPIVDRLLEYRELFKLKSTYVDALQRLVNPSTQRIHTTFQQTVAATGRLSSSDPNLQNIPIRNPRGRRLRCAFVAPQGYKLVAADYSQIELRVLAHLSGDENLIATFERGEDIHLATARDIFGDRPDSEMKELRRVAKTINFGVIYGISAFRLSQELGISRREAQTYIHNYFARFPRVAEYFDQVTQRSAEEGYVETLLGHRRYVQDIDTAGRDAGYVNRSLLNAPIQGTAAEIIKLAMINVFRGLPQFNGQARLILQVHDELLFEVKESVIDSCREFIVREMEQCIELAVPLKVDVRVGQNWGEAE